MDKRQRNIKKNAYDIIKIGIIIYLFVMGYFLEISALNPQVTMVGSLFAFIFMNEILRAIFNERKNLRYYSMMASVLLVYIMGEFTIVNGNYFLFSFYIILIVDGITSLKKPFAYFYTSFVMFLSVVRLISNMIAIESIEGIGYLVFYVIICGLIISIIEFSNRQKLEKEINRKLYEDLNKLHQEIEDLILVKERNRIARDIHDTLGHQWMATIMQLEMVEQLIHKEPDLAKQRIIEIKDTARESMKSVRGVVETLQEDGKLTLTQALIGMILKFEKRSGLKIQYKFKGDIEYKKHINDTVFRLVQESITNATRHGKAQNVTIEITFKKKIIVFEIKDDGIGATDITKGFGLNGMTERIKKIGGDIDFDGSDGFKVSGIITISNEVKT